MEDKTSVTKTGLNQPGSRNLECMPGKHHKFPPSPTLAFNIKCVICANIKFIFNRLECAQDETDFASNLTTGIDQ